MNGLRRRVLLVEDDADDAALFTRKLEVIGRYVVLLAADGQSAIRILQDAERSGEPPDVIFVDLRLPGMHGLEFLTWLRHRPEFAGIPRHAISGVITAIERFETSAQGARHVLEKPINATALAFALTA